MNRDFRFKIEYIGVQFLLACVYVLPQSVLRPFGALLGWAAFSVLRIRRSVAINNVRSSLGSAEHTARAIACRSYMNLGRSLVEFAAFRKFSAEDVRRLVAIEGTEYLEEALHAGRGAVLFTGHFGNWELLAARAVSEGFPFHALVGEQSNRKVDALINSLRQSQHVGVIFQKAGLRQVLRVLADNEFVAILADQDARKRGIFVDFLGRPASTFREPARLAIQCGCPIVTGFIIRQRRGMHLAKIQQPLWPKRNLTGEEAILDLTQSFTALLETFVRDHPDQYFWAHRRWKTRPPQEHADTVRGGAPAVSTEKERA
ncbi:MAG: lysophospholipid acyltransferase family protein [Candidatus Latescibacterota bacterium]